MFRIRSPILHANKEINQFKIYMSKWKLCVQVIIVSLNRSAIYMFKNHKLLNINEGNVDRSGKLVIKFTDLHQQILFAK